MCTQQVLPVDFMSGACTRLEVVTVQIVVVHSYGEGGASGDLPSLNEGVACLGGSPDPQAQGVGGEER